MFNTPVLAAVPYSLSLLRFHSTRSSALACALERCLFCFYVHVLLRPPLRASAFGCSVNFLYMRALWIDPGTHAHALRPTRLAPQELARPCPIILRPVSCCPTRVLPFSRFRRPPLPLSLLSRGPLPVAHEPACAAQIRHAPFGYFLLPHEPPSTTADRHTQRSTLAAMTRGRHTS